MLPPTTRAQLRPRFSNEYEAVRDDSGRELPAPEGVIGYARTGEISPAEAASALADLEPLLRPIEPERLAREITVGLTVTKSRAGEEADKKILGAVFARQLAEFPADVVAGAFDGWIRCEVWRPAPAEIRERCNRLMRARRSLAFQLRRAAEGAPLDAPRLADHGEWKHMSKEEAAAFCSKVRAAVASLGATNAKVGKPVADERKIRRAAANAVIAEVGRRINLSDVPTINAWIMANDPAGVASLALFDGAVAGEDTRSLVDAFMVAVDGVATRNPPLCGGVLA
jgi:hypothetical protein